jgi:hypothetical protein
VALAGALTIPVAALAEESTTTDKQNASKEVQDDADCRRDAEFQRHLRQEQERQERFRHVRLDQGQAEQGRGHKSDQDKVTGARSARTSSRRNPAAFKAAYRNPKRRSKR